MGTVPEVYFQFVMEYAPYVYVIPPDTPDPAFGQGVLAASFAIDFLCEAYSAKQFEDRKAEVYDKIVSLADWVLTQQCTDPARKAYGGFKSSETSTYYYSVDACRVIPSLLRAYELTNDSSYLDAAKLAGGTFLKTMQDQQAYGGFARAVTIGDAWLLQMDIECLYGLVGLKLLAEKHDTSNAAVYQSIMGKAVGFLREGLENLWLHFDPSDGKWHRVGLAENEVYDDPFAYALVGLYEVEGWSLTCQRVYNFLNNIRASATYPAYDPAVCWAGYIDVVSRFVACDYYDAVTSGILWRIRRNHDQPSLKFSVEVIGKHSEEFMFWGVKHAEYSFVENKWAMATVCWIAQLFLNYEEPTTQFTKILRSKGEAVTLYPVRQAAVTVSYGEPLDLLAVVSPLKAEQVMLEAGYYLSDYLAFYTFLPVRVHDKIRRQGEDYEIQTVTPFTFANQRFYFKSIARRLIAS
ncbi:hypothetical protein G4O51_03105 [Candidatus Bathyarchaeota archaeon A05DMB-2]|jgi:hypothetical protein|nr:hypothetical protein [Candidatus Bathyarchaeota archaeon A05DMB-2]